MAILQRTRIDDFGKAVRAGHQQQDREGARIDNPVVAAGASRQRDRINGSAESGRSPQVEK